MGRSPLAENLEQVRGRIAAACARANREVAEVTLVAVTKTAAPEQIREIVQLGVADLGESRAQVLGQRMSQINEFFQRRQGHGDTSAPTRLRWHMIGHLQRNKVKAVLPMVQVVHSVDSLRLAEEIEIQATKMKRPAAVLMQVNASEEKSKFGVAVGAAVHLGEQIASMENVDLIGLMAMAPLEGGDAAARSAFRRAREVFEDMRWHKIGGSGFRHLSMGMSHDFEIAIEEGATLVRVGSALFGGDTGSDAEFDED